MKIEALSKIHKAKCCITSLKVSLLFSFFIINKKIKKYKNKEILIGK